MKDLIEALTILAKWVDDEWPTHCTHDQFAVKGPRPRRLTNNERKRLKTLSFHYDAELEMWVSFRFGSC